MLRWVALKSASVLETAKDGLAAMGRPTGAPGACSVAVGEGSAMVSVRGCAGSVATGLLGCAAARARDGWALAGGAGVAGGTGWGAKNRTVKSGRWCKGWTEGVCGHRASAPMCSSNTAMVVGATTNAGGDSGVTEMGRDALTIT